MKKLLVTITTTSQLANEVLGTPNKTLHYLILGEGNNKVIINVGEKTNLSVMKLLNETEEELKKDNGSKYTDQEIKEQRKHGIK